MKKYYNFIKIYPNLTSKQKEEIWKVLEFIERTDEAVLKYQNTIKILKNMVEANVPNLYLTRLIKSKKLGCGMTKLKMIILYSRVGFDKWESYVNKQKISNTFEYKSNKFGMSIEEFNSFNKSRAVTLYNMQLKYGENIGKDKFEAYKEKQRYAGCSKDYFIEKYGIVKGIEEYKRINQLKTHTVESVMKRHNINENSAIELLTQSRNKQYKSGKKSSIVSKISQELFWGIYHKLPEELKSKCYFGELNKEFSKYSKDDKSLFSYDFCISNISYIIEYNGDFFHANPNKYKESDYIRIGGKNILVSNIWLKDKQKKNLMENLGFVYNVVWDSEYRNNKEEIIRKLVDEIITTYQFRNS